MLHTMPQLAALLAAVPAGAADAASGADGAPLLSVASLLALVTLTLMEIVLGIDNIVFIAILSGRLPEEKRQRARRLGLLGAMVMRVLFLLAIGWIVALKDPWLTFSLWRWDVALSWRDIILLVGGLFLIAKATHEIHGKLEGGAEHVEARAARHATMASVITQIMLMDLIFSIDSVITAVGMAQHLTVMIAAVVISIVVMMVFAGPISDFVERHPTVKMLALSFLLLIGVMLVAEGFGAHINRGYIYFAMGFSLFVELLNLRLRRTRQPVRLHQPRLPEAAGGPIMAPSPGARGPDAEL